MKEIRLRQPTKRKRRAPFLFVFFENVSKGATKTKINPKSEERKKRGYRIKFSQKLIIDTLKNIVENKAIKEGCFMKIYLGLEKERITYFSYVQLSFSTL